MKLLAIGDLHGDLKKIKKIPIKDIDLILLTGDLGKADLARKRYFENIERKKKGLEKLEYTPLFMKKIYLEIYNSILQSLNYLSKFAPTYSILGNVGENMIKNSKVEKDEKKYGISLPYLGKEIRNLKNFHLVRNCKRKINKLKIGFLDYFVDTSWVKEFNERDKKKIRQAKKETLKAKKVLENFKHLDVLICHQPPYGFLDKVDNKFAPKNWSGKHAGSKIILDYIKKYQPKYVFCGHIHEGKGKTNIGKTEIYNLGVAEHKIINFYQNSY